MDKITVIAIIAGLATGVSTAAIASTAITQKDKTFSQESVTVKAGEKIRFVNDDDVTHNITVQGPNGVSTKGVPEKPGTEIELAFEDVGVSMVHCLIHPKMKLTVEVQ